MGEGNTVKLSPRLRKGQRGAVIDPADSGEEPNKRSQLRDRVHCNQQVVACALLFNEKLDFPELGTSLVAKDPPSAYQRFPFFCRSTYVPKGSWVGEITLDVYKAHDRREPRAWTIWSAPRGSAWRRAVPDLAFKLSLQNAFIVPHREVPIDDILFFKERRHAELAAFRRHFDDLCIKVSQSGPDPGLARIELERFEDALTDYIRVAREPNWKKVIARLEVSMDWVEAARKLATPLLSGGAALAMLDLEAAVAAFIGGAASALTVSSASTHERARSERPFEYFVLMERELY